MPNSRGGFAQAQRQREQRRRGRLPRIALAQLFGGVRLHQGFERGGRGVADDPRALHGSGIAAVLGGVGDGL